MGKKKSFYFTDEDLEIYEQVKSYAGDSLSSIVTDAFREYLRKRQAVESQYVEVKIWRGIRDYIQNEAKKEQFKFWGKLLASDSRPEDCTEDTQYFLYETKKKQYLVYWYKFDKDTGIEKSNFFVEKDMKGLRKHNLPENLLVQAEKVMGDDHYVELDV